VKNKFVKSIMFLTLLLSMPIISQVKSDLDLIRERQAMTGGTIIGKITDEKSGEDLIGANVFIVNTKLGASTDIDGKFQIKKVPEGTYNVRISFLGYETKVISGVVSKNGEQIVLNVSIGEDQGIQQQEVVISASVIKSGEGAILAERKKAASIGDGISSEQMKKAPDATSGDALKRVTGVTIVDNKFIYVRGTSERYSNTTLNGTAVSGSEPEKKSFSFDMFPSNLLESIVIAKTFTPDIPGDFAGGNVQLSTVEFPETFSVRIGVSGGYNTQTSLKNFESYKSGSKDWLGIDDGTRSIPNGVPADIAKGTFTPNELQNIGRLFNNNWKTGVDGKAPMNSGFDLSIGNAFDAFGEGQFGFIAALTYKNSYNRSIIDRNDYDYDKSKFEYIGHKTSYSVLWGGMANLSYKIDPFNKISLKNNYNRNADDEVSYLEGVDYDAPYDRQTTAIRYVEREVLSTQLGGEHVFTEMNGTQIQWRVSNSESNRNEPDYRRYSYVRDAGTTDQFRILMDYQASLKNGGRYYSDLKDIVRNYAADVTMPLGDFKIKLGGLYEDKDRNFNSRLIGYVYPAANFDFNLFYYSIDSIFAPQNLKSTGFKVAEYSSGFNNYSASQATISYYAMIDVPFNFFDQNFRFITGARVENVDQRVASKDFSGTTPIVGGAKKVDILPSVNITWLLTDIINLRLAYSNTVNRPELRELAPFTYYDFNTQTSIYGNPALKRALIENYDFRFEVFPRPGEVISFSLFYKNIHDAIELASVPGSALGADRTYVNASRAKNFGYEIEFRQGLGLFTNYLTNVALTGNYAQVKSSVDVINSGFGIGKTDRPLQGQSPYMINLGLIYSLSDYGFNVSLSYNKFGERISELATQYTEDIKEQPRNLLDFTLTQAISENVEGKFSMKDIFHEAQVFTISDKVARKNTMGTIYSLGFSYKL